MNNSRRTNGSVPTYQQSLTSAQMATRPTVQFSPPPQGGPPQYQPSGYNSVMTTPNTTMGVPHSTTQYSKSGYKSQVCTKNNK